MRSFVIVIFLLFTLRLMGQLAPNFNVKDTGNKTHRLYEDYLDQGKVVVFKVFFVNCPPCNTIAPAVQQKYVEWGSGNGNVQFIEMTNKIGDTDPYVIGYKNKHGLTFPSISSDGGALTAIIPYTDGTFGLWSGTPLFVVIAPNKTVHYDVLFSNLNTIIGIAGGTIAKPPTTVNLGITSPVNPLPPGVSYILKSANSTSPKYNITSLTGGSNQFTYPSTTFPEISNPVIELESTAEAKSSLLSVTDLVAIKNHVLGIALLTDQKQIIAGDVNGSGHLSVSDIVAIQKVILGTVNKFPNNTPSYKLLPAQIPFTVPQQGGGTVTIQGELLKMGNVR